MSDRLVTLAAFRTPVEANLAAGALEAAGIESFLEGELAGTSLSHVGTALGGVKLQVREMDAERAEVVLRELDSSASSGEPWTCGCGASVDGGFDLCWSCGAVRPEGPAEFVPSEPAPDEAAVPCPMCGAPLGRTANNCFRCGERVDAPRSRTDDREPQREDDSDSSPARESLRRAWRAAVIGIGVCPGVLHVYSATLLIDYYRNKAADGSDDDWRSIATACIDGLFILGVIALWSRIFRH